MSARIKPAWQTEPLHQSRQGQGQHQTQRKRRELRKVVDQIHGWLCAAQYKFGNLIAADHILFLGIIVPVLSKKALTFDAKNREPWACRLFYDLVSDR
jgi:hypothetical protein